MTPSLEMRAELHFVVVHGEVGETSANSKSFSLGLRSRLYCSNASSTVCFVRLFFSSKVATGRPLMNRHSFQGKLGVVVAVAQLSGHAEAVLFVQDPGLLIPCRRSAVHQVELVRAVLDALAQHVDGPALGDFPLQP